MLAVPLPVEEPVSVLLEALGELVCVRLGIAVCVQEPVSVAVSESVCVEDTVCVDIAVCVDDAASVAEIDAAMPLGEAVRLPVIESVSGMLGELLGKAVPDSDLDEVRVADTGLTEGSTVLLLLVEGVLVDERVSAAVPEPAPEPDAVPDNDPVLVPETVPTGELGRAENDLEDVLLGVRGGVMERDTTVGTAVWL